MRIFGKWAFSSLCILCFVFVFSFSLYAQQSQNSLKYRSDSLFAAGVDLYNSSRFKDAIPYFEKCHAVDTLIYSTADSRRYYAPMWLSSCYYKLGNRQKAASLYDGYMVAPLDRRLVAYSDSLSLEVYHLLYEMGDAKSALPLIEEILAYETKAVGANTLWVANTHSAYSYALYSTGEVQKALESYHRSLSILADICGDYSKPYAAAFADLVQLWLDTGDYENAVSGARKLLEIGRRENDPNSPYTYSAYSVLGEYYLTSGNFSESVSCYEEAIKILDNNSGDPYSKYNKMYCLDYLAQAQFAAGDVDKAIGACILALDICRSNGWEDDYVFANVNALLYNMYEFTGSPMLARSYAETAIQRFKALGVPNINYADLLLRYSQRLKSDEKYERALGLSLDAVSVLESIPGVQDTVLAIGYSAVTELYYFNNNIRKATEYATKAVNDINWEKSPSAGSPVHYNVLKQYAQYANASGDYVKAADCQRKAVAMAKHLYGEASDEYSTAFTMLLTFLGAITDPAEREDILSARSDTSNRIIFEKAYTAIALQDFPLAIKLLNDQVQRLEKCMEDAGEQPRARYVHEYIAVLMLRANVFTQMELFTNSLVSLEKAANAISKLPPIIQNNYNFGYWNILGKTYLKMSLFDKAQDAFAKSLFYSESFNGPHHIETLLVRVFLSVARIENGDAKSAIEELAAACDLIKENLFYTFGTMSSSERMNFWRQIAPVYNLCLPKLVYDHGDLKYSGFAYDALLFSKGLLLSTERSVLSLVEEHFDMETFSEYEHLLDLRLRFQMEPTAALKDSVKMAERKIIAMSSRLGDYTYKLRTGWKDVQASLKNKDVAIEFANIYENGEQLYIAFVLSKDMKSPQMVRLFNQTEFEKITYAEYYTTPSLYNLLLKPLLPYFKKGGNIYFAPTGILHNIALESLTSVTGRIISQDYSLHRLSSTRELVGREPVAGDASSRDASRDFARSNSHNISLFGGIDYNADGAGISLATALAVAKKSGDRGYQQLLLEPLDGAKTEIDSIGALLKQHSVRYEKYFGSGASETVVKSLSGKENTVLHIATHGFYLQQSDPVSDHIMDIISLENMNAEDNALNKSGLYFAGANHSLLDSAPVEKINDGILTSREVAALDLRSVELVVLSACETGLGDIDGEGVFGLQRGFKKAGANTLLMSLWKVDDEATCYLMTHFYRHWLGGKSKHQALELAKNAVRTRADKKWDDPKCWAAFVLLDALEK